MKMHRKTHQHLILVTCVTTAVAVLIGMVSLATEEWVTAVVRAQDISTEDSYVNYGLFSGTFDRFLLRHDYYLITMTCNGEGQACAMLCMGTSEDRDKQLSQLLANDDIKFESGCPRIQRNVQPADLDYPIIRSHRATDDRTYIDYSLYVTTVALLVFSIAAGIAATGFSIWNTIGNPIYTVFNVISIIGLNTVAAICATLTIVVWGIQYNITLIDNIAVLDTITNDMKTREPSLGYSFWINIVSIVLYCTSVGLIMLRKVFVDREPQATNMEMIRSDDRTIVLF